MAAESPGGIHPAAAAGFRAGAQAYDRGRPGYPNDALSFLIEALRITGDATVLDVGAGTGKLTRLLDPTGAQLVAIEPVASMHGILARQAPRAHVVAARAEELPVRDAGVDAIVVAQAFHWFDGLRAVEELHRVLRHAGRLGVVFNRRDEADELAAALGSIFEPHRGVTPTHRFDAWRSAFDETAAFSPLLLRSFANPHRQSIDEAVDRVVSISFIAALPDDERSRVAADVRRVVSSRAADHGGSVEMAYRTDVFWAERR